MRGTGTDRMDPILCLKTSRERGATRNPCMRSCGEASAIAACGEQNRKRDTGHRRDLLLSWLLSWLRVATSLTASTRRRSRLSSTPGCTLARHGRQPAQVRILGHGYYIVSGATTVGTLAGASTSPASSRVAIHGLGKSGMSCRNGKAPMSVRHQQEDSARLSTELFRLVSFCVCFLSRRVSAFLQRRAVSCVRPRFLPRNVSSGVYPARISRGAHPEPCRGRIPVVPRFGGSF